MRYSLKGISGWLKNSFIDYPGKVSSVLFYSGCNLRCPYCHNPSLIDRGQEHEFDPDELCAFLCKRSHLIDGVVLTGGEPSLSRDMPELVKELKETGYSVKLDTNGLQPDVIERADPDYIAIDLKTLPDLYTDLLSCRYPVPGERLERSLEYASYKGENAEVRITAAPEIIDKKSAEAMSSMIPEGIRKVFIQPVKLDAGVLDKEFFSSEITQDYIDGIKKRFGSDNECRCEVRAA